MMDFSDGLRLYVMGRAPQGQVELGEGSKWCNQVVSFPEPPGLKLVPHEDTGHSPWSTLGKFLFFVGRGLEVNKASKREPFTIELLASMTPFPIGYTRLVGPNVGTKAKMAHSAGPKPGRKPALKKRATGTTHNFPNQPLGNAIGLRASLTCSRMWDTEFIRGLA